jgi:predicted kinase
VLLALAQQQLGHLHTVVLEGNFRPGEHEPAVRALLARQGLSSCTQILCRVPETVRQARLQARAGDPHRHPGHRDATWVAPAEVRGDAFLDLDGPRFSHDGSMIDPGPGSELIRSLANRHLV